MWSKSEIDEMELAEGNFLIISVLSQYIVYGIKFKGIHAFTYQKTLLDTLFLLVVEIVISLQCILNNFLNDQLYMQC